MHDLWTRVTVGDSLSVRKFVQVMSPFDSAWADFARVRRWIAKPVTHVYLYRGRGFELVVGFEYDPVQQLCHTGHVGIAGMIIPKLVLELLMRLAHGLATELGVNTVYGRLPRSMNTQPFVEAMMNLGEHDPRIAMTAVSTTPKEVVWKFELDAALSTQAVASGA